MEQGQIAAKVIAPTAQNDSIACLKGKGSNLDGDIGARFINDPNDADGDAAAA